MIQDARARQRRHRRVGATVLLAAAAAAAGALLAHGGNRGPVDHRGPVAQDGTQPLRGAGLRLGRGPSSVMFHVNAPASHAYDVRVSAPSAVVAVVRVNGDGLTLELPRGQGCTVKAGRTSCVLHYAQGGNPGGVWTGTVTKSSIPAARVRVTFAFAAHAGDYPG